LRRLERWQWLKEQKVIEMGYGETSRISKERKSDGIRRETPGFQWGMATTGAY
jgi:hypothetical protein